MSAGTVPIVSNVGGMTNVVLNGFNGLIVHPKTEEFISAIELLINDFSLMKELSHNAKKTVIGAFSKDKWSEEWLKVIKSVLYQ